MYLDCLPGSFLRGEHKISNNDSQPHNVLNLGLPRFQAQFTNSQNPDTMGHMEPAMAHRRVMRNLIAPAGFLIR